MTATTYDSKAVSVIVGGVYLTGFSEDMVEVEKDEDNFEVKVGAQGDTVRTKVNNPLGTATVTLQQTSPQVPYLDGLANSGKLVPVTIINAGPPKETITVTEAFIKKPAARTYGNEAEDREYEFVLMDMLFS
ncbi:phage structural protein [Paenibacillus sp. EC2-1]|uniref:phage structural protein n=1 Tax=Paenibacillus sp. EC2-1 TaxID=3388665 RepID=UPI003BEECCB0